MSQHIKDYWDQQARAHGASHWASWGDNWAIELEIDTIGRHLGEGASILDVGCANGYSTYRQLLNKNPSSIIGIDYSEDMIKAAQSIIADVNSDRIEFQVGDIRNIPFPDRSFDFVYTTRVLINLPTWDEQKQGILECVRVTKPGGKVIFSEGFWEPLSLLNSLRLLKNLPPLVEHDFNRYLKMSKASDFLSELGLDFFFDDFSSIYYLGSRFLREIVTDPSQFEGFSNPINKIFFDIEKEFSGGGFGVQQAIIVTKPA